MILLLFHAFLSLVGKEARICPLLLYNEMCLYPDFHY